MNDPKINGIKMSIRSKAGKICIILILMLSASCEKEEVNDHEVNDDFTQFPSLLISNNFGVNYHLYNAHAEDPQLIKEAGLRIVRIDLNWHEIETEMGIYDFSPMEYVVNSFHEKNFVILFILNSTNPLYEDNYSIVTENGRTAFANFAAEAVKNYKDYKVIWEIWNEPDVFWIPKPCIDNYMKLVKKTAPAIRNIDPNALILAPASGDLSQPFDFLQSCFDKGLLNYVNGISVHPYRYLVPETVLNDIEALRNLINQYENPYDAEVIASEWGYSPIIDTSGISEPFQAALIQRMFLIDFMAEVPITIWYDWRNDGLDQHEYNHNFGLVYANSTEKKPAYFALKGMIDTLKNMEFYGRINVGNNDDFCLLFKHKDKNNYIVAAWTKDDTFSFSEHNVDLLPSKTITVDYSPEYHAVSQAEVQEFEYY